MDSDQALNLVHKLVAAFPTANVGDDTVVLWLGRLLPLSPETARAAVDAVIGSCKWFPTVAEFNEALGGVREHSRTELPAAKPQPLSEPEREAARARLASLQASIGRRDRFTLPAVSVTNPSKSRGRKYVVDPETGHAETIRETERA